MLRQCAASLLDGLLLGCVYGAAAMGLNLIWGVMKVINLSHGALMTAGMFVVYGLFAAAGLNPYLALPVAALAGWLLGLAIYWVAVHRVIDAPELASLLATFAVNMILVGLGTWLLTGTPRNIDCDLGAWRLGPLVIQGNRLAAAGAAVVLAGALFLFLRRTTLGKAIRATADNRGAAELMGIATSRTLALSFGLGAMLACTAGALIATIFPFTIASGAAYEPKSFVICVLGGLGNPLGALAAGLLLGAAEGLAPVFLPVGWTPALEFGLFVLVLVVRPTGLFGKSGT
jgi:branched-subunit amino acid ABC-type transport system permease component